MRRVGLLALVVTTLWSCTSVRGGGVDRTTTLHPGFMNGLVAYTFDGDVYVGDLVTGDTTAIVTGPE
jgi:hypothetical protein